MPSKEATEEVGVLQQAGVTDTAKVLMMNGVTVVTGTGKVKMDGVLRMVLHLEWPGKKKTAGVV